MIFIGFKYRQRSGHCCTPPGTGPACDFNARWHNEVTVVTTVRERVAVLMLTA